MAMIFHNVFTVLLSFCTFGEHKRLKHFFPKLFKGSIFKSENSDFVVNLLQRSRIISPFAHLNIIRNTEKIKQSVSYCQYFCLDSTW